MDCDVISGRHEKTCFNHKWQRNLVTAHVSFYLQEKLSIRSKSLKSLHSCACYLFQDIHLVVQELYFVMLQRYILVYKRPNSSSQASCIYFMQSLPHIGVNFSTQSLYECQHMVFNSCFFLNPSDDYGIMRNKQVRKMELFGYHICNVNVNVTDIK